MIRRIRYRWRKDIDNIERSAQQDVCMNRPKDNPFKAGTAEHALYEKAYEDTVEKLADEQDGARRSKWPPRRGAIRREYNRRSRG